MYHGLHRGQSWRSCSCCSHFFFFFSFLKKINTRMWLRPWRGAVVLASSMIVSVGVQFLPYASQFVYYDMDCKGVSVHSSGSNLQKQRLVPVSDMLVTICFSIHRGIYLVSSHPDWEVDWHGTFPTRPTFLHIHQHTLLLAYPTVPLSLNLRNSQVPLCGWCSVMIGQSREIISFRSLLVVW